eukprot:scaffold29115_cov1319-Skeletonema_menzelii.AAC.19
MPTGGSAIMRNGENLLYLARKEQCLALSTQLRTFKINDYKIYRIFPSGEVQYLHPKDGVFPEKVNPGRTSVNSRGFSIVQVATGFAMTFYYRPSVVDAFASVEYIMTSVNFGWLIRSIHRWSARVPAAVPVVGPPLVLVLRGGESVGQSTLTRFYSAHTFVLPLAAAVLMLTHFLMIRKQGISGPL